MELLLALKFPENVGEIFRPTATENCLKVVIKVAIYPEMIKNKFKNNFILHVEAEKLEEPENQLPCCASMFKAACRTCICVVARQRN